MGCLCQNCGNDYKVDLILPDLLWRKISPNKNESGLLCPICIGERLEDLGINMTFQLTQTKKEEEEIYCHQCSAAGGAEMPIFHRPPPCGESSALPEKCWLCQRSDPFPETIITVGCKTPGGEECDPYPVRVHYACYMEIEP